MLAKCVTAMTPPTVSCTLDICKGMTSAVGTPANVTTGYAVFTNLVRSCVLSSRVVSTIGRPELPITVAAMLRTADLSRTDMRFAPALQLRNHVHYSLLEVG